MLIVNPEVVDGRAQGFQELISGHKVVKTGQGNRILHPRIMCVKGDDIGYPHLHQLLQCQRAVQGFPLASLVLTAFV